MQKLLYYSASFTEFYVKSFSEFKISGSLVKGTLPKHVTVALKTVANGEHYFCPESLARTMEILSTKSVFDPLTKTEKIIFSQLAVDVKNETIADTLNCSLETVRSHKKNIFKKMGFSNRQELKMLALDSGFYPVGRMISSETNKRSFKN